MCYAAVQHVLGMRGTRHVSGVRSARRLTLIASLLTAQSGAEPCHHRRGLGHGCRRGDEYKGRQRLLGCPLRVCDQSPCTIPPAGSDGMSTAVLAWNPEGFLDNPTENLAVPAARNCCPYADKFHQRYVGI